MRIKLLALYIVCLLSSCAGSPSSMEFNNLSTYTSNGADFLVTNLSTGESERNKGIIIASDMTTVALGVEYGQKLLFEYFPPEKFAKGTFHVTFSFNSKDYVVSQSPFQLELVVGEDTERDLYLITCKGECSLWTEESRDFGVVPINVK